MWIFRRGLTLALQLILLGTLAPAAAAPSTDIVLSKAAASVRVDRGVELLIEEPGENFTRTGVMRPELAGRWAIYHGKKINLPGQPKPVWVRFGVHREAGDPATQWVLGIDWPVQKSVDFHQFDPDSARWVATRSAGLSRPASDQLLKAPSLLFPLELGSAQRAIVLLRVQTDSQFVLPLTLWDEKELQASLYDHAVLMGLLFGILGVMFFYNLSLFIFTRERSFVSYSAYLLCTVLYELAVTGFGPLYLWGGNEWLKARGYELFSCGGFLVAAIFFRQFLDLKMAARYLNRSNQAIIGFWLIVTAMSLLQATPLLGVFIGAGGIFSSLAGIYTSVYLALKRNVLAQYFVVAWAAIITGTVVNVLVLFGLIEGGGWVDHAQQIGFVVEMVLLSIALAWRIKREKASKEAAQRELLELAQSVEHERDEKIRAQERTLTVQLQANEELELRVLDRTAELERAMKNVELANVELARLSVTDALTKVHNRRYFDEMLKKEHDRSARTGAPLALLLADIDYFKKINDSVGHLAGDECLKQVASALTSAVGRSTDLVARYGGEEFAIVLPATDAAQALAVAERVRKAVEDIQFMYCGKRIPISISLGVVARVAGTGRPVSDFVSEADEALYAAKGAGRNQVQLAANG